MFRSFFMAGFEAATGFNAKREWIDQVADTQHDRFLAEDYARLADLGIFTVREAVRWPIVDRRGSYDFTTLDSILAAATQHGMELIFDLFHYGYPVDLDPFSPVFVDRFASYCDAVARHVSLAHAGPVAFTPVNEPSYFAWAAGDAALFAPHETDRSFELKMQLARAAIEGVNAILDRLPHARIVHADPVCRVCCPCGRPDLEDEVRAFNEGAVFQSLDMISGRLEPGLGGSEKHLGVIGVNYYWTNQWEHGSPESPLDEDDERCWALRDIVRWVWHRYRRPILITETSHVGERRAPYLHQLEEEIRAILSDGIPLEGVCIYPVLGMPEWHDRAMWTQMGLWDLSEAHGILERVPNWPAIHAFERTRDQIAKILPQKVGVKSGS